jgi:hypothetical protein
MVATARLLNDLSLQRRNPVAEEEVALCVRRTLVHKKENTSL